MPDDAKERVGEHSSKLQPSINLHAPNAAFMSLRIFGHRACYLGILLRLWPVVCARWWLLKKACLIYSGQWVCKVNVRPADLSDLSNFLWMSLVHVDAGPIQVDHEADWLFWGPRWNIIFLEQLCIETVKRICDVELHMVGNILFHVLDLLSSLTPWGRLGRRWPTRIDLWIYPISPRRRRFSAGLHATDTLRHAYIDFLTYSGDHPCR